MALAERFISVVSTYFSSLRRSTLNFLTPHDLMKFPTIRRGCLESYKLTVGPNKNLLEMRQIYTSIHKERDRYGNVLSP